MEKAGLVSVDAAVQHEDIRGHHRAPYRELGRSFDVIGAIHQFGSTISVDPPAELISSAEITRWHVCLDQTHVTLCFLTFLDPGEVWIDISLAPLAAERTFLAKIDQWNFTRTLGIVVLTGLSQRLYHQAKSDATLLLHLLILWS